MKQGQQRIGASAVVTRGNAKNGVFFFEQGGVVAPFSVGCEADWSVSAPGVAAVHFYLCFDGETLFGASLPDGPGVLAGSISLGSGWTALPSACEVSFGEASIFVTTSAAGSLEPRMAGSHAELPFGDDPFDAPTLMINWRETRARPPSTPPLGIASAISAPASRSDAEDASDSVPSPRPFAKPSASRALHALMANTIIKPVVAPMQTVAPARMALTSIDLPALVPAGALPFLQPGAPQCDGAPAPAEAPRPLIPAAGRPIAARSPARALERADASSRAASAGASATQKVIAALIVAAVALFGVRAWTRHRAADPAQRPAASARVAAALPTRDASPTAPAAPVPEHATTATAAGTEEPLAMSDGKTPERQAVDLIARGAYADAAALYERLARHSEDPKFKDAARIARRKARNR